MEPSTHSPEHVPVPGQPEAVHYEPRQLEYGERGNDKNERLGGLASSAERYPAATERQPQAPAASATSVTLPAPLTDESSSTAAAVSDDTPLVAADDDLIEKEWVDKAKKILLDTKDDPYEREQRVKKLQLEYVRKRYGREIGDPGD